MTLRQVSLHDRYDLSKGQVLLNGTQALVRLMMMQKARDKAKGWNTGGYVTGYRGSPLGAVDMQMARAERDLTASDVLFQPGLNEDLAATAVWGTQQAELRGEGKYDGVFSLWYGKGPGVDRSGDVMRHANMAGTSPKGGVIMAMGDDHTGESSTTCHQSDWAMVDAYIPVISPAGVQEILDYGFYAFELSRYAGVWTGLKLMKDTVEVTSVVDARVDRVAYKTPDMVMPPDGVNIRLNDHWIAQEARMIDTKRFAAEAFSRTNRIDRRVWGKAGAKIGFVAAGKNWLDLEHALSLLGLDAAEAERLGITTYKIGQTFPLDMKSFTEWAEELELIVVVEEKRKLIEVQIKEAIFDDRRGRRVYGWYKGGAGRLHEEELFPTRMALDPVMIAEKIGEILIEEDRGTDPLRTALNLIREAQKADNAEDIAARTPYFCSGCPHNTSTKVPDGSRAYAGIGCHIMALWMDRETSGYTHMGAEGANWIGEAPFSTRDHVFQNLGDGTYNHSGTLAIRAAVAAGTKITYKILYNDAVAMTGGQGNDGALKPDQIVRELQAVGVKTIALVHDPKEDLDLSVFPSGIDIQTRDKLPQVQAAMTKVDGVSAIVFVQTCAAEKRRRRKRKLFPDPDRRVFINTDVCEGCGDCGVQSNCVSIVPVETPLGRKRAIDQSSCNKDFSCVNGFCPSFVSVAGGTPKKAAKAEVKVGDMPTPDLPKIDGTHNVVITGVGGTGVVTIGAVLAMAAHLDGKGAGVMEMAGLAQKGGAVHIHCRLADAPEDISAIRVATGEADLLIGGDLVVSAGAKTLGLVRTEHTAGVVNTHETVTGDFTRNTEFRIPGDRLQLSLRRRMGDRLTTFDATGLAEVAMGDTIFSNMIVFGAAWQMGHVPLSLEAIQTALDINGAVPEKNKQAFELGRWAVVHPKRLAQIVEKVLAPVDAVEDAITHRAAHLMAYQDEALMQKYLTTVGTFEDADLKEAVAKGYHKVLAYKDEYEVARLLTETRAKANEAFEGDLKLTFHLAPPLLSRMGPNGRPLKRNFGGWVEWLFPRLAKMKGLRGTVWDVFGYTSERREERRLIKTYEDDLKLIAEKGADAPESAKELALLPVEIRGFGPVKHANLLKAKEKRDVLRKRLVDGDAPKAMAAE